MYLSKDCGSDVSLLNPIRQPNEWATKYHGVVNFFCFAKPITASKSNWYSSALEMCWILGREGNGLSESPQPLQSSVETLNPFFIKNSNVTEYFSINSRCPFRKKTVPRALYVLVFHIAIRNFLPSSAF